MLGGEAEDRLHPRVRVVVDDLLFEHQALIQILDGWLSRWLLIDFVHHDRYAQGSDLLLFELTTESRSVASFEIGGVLVRVGDRGVAGKHILNSLLDNLLARCVF